MIQFLKENEENFPQLTFIEYGDKKYAYEEFLFQVIHTSRILKSYKIPKQSLIGIQIPNPLEFLIHWFACNYLGLTSVLINPKIGGEELQKNLDSTPLKTLFTSRNSIRKIDNSKIDIIFIEDAPSISTCGDEIKCYNWNDIDTITIIFTSGSDGWPKPVELTAGNFISSFKSWNYEISFNNDKIINFLPLHHIAGISAIFRGLLSQSPIHLIDKFHVESFLENCQKFNPTIVSMVPTVIYNLLKTEEGITCLKSFRMILVGGGPSHKSILETCLTHEINIFVTYGMTETCSGVSGFWIKKNPDKLGSIGKPFKEMTVSITNTKEEFSKICILGENISNGYFGENRLNHQFFSNDLGRFDEDGFLYLKPLRKDRIVTGGENVNPFEVENVILKIQEVQDCCVMGIEDFEWGEKIIAFIKCSKKLDKMEIIEFCSERILDYKIPKEIIFCEELPRTELGKINREKGTELLKDYGHI